MKLISLTLTEKDGDLFRVDFADRESVTAAGKAAVVEAVRRTLFGDGISTGGEGILECEIGGANYRLERNFADGEVSILKDGALLPEDAAKIVAPLGAEKWEEFATESRSDMFGIDRYFDDIIVKSGVKKSDIINETERYAEEKRRLDVEISAVEGLREDISGEVGPEKAEELRSALGERKAAAEKHNRNEELRARAEKIKAETLEVAARRREILNRTERQVEQQTYRDLFFENRRLEKLNEDLGVRANSLEAEIEKKEKELSAFAKGVETKSKAYESDERALKDLRTRYRSMLEENPVKGEFTATVKRILTEREGERASVAGKEAAVAVSRKRLAEIHSDFAKKLAIREGASLETIIAEQKTRLETLDKVIENNRAEAEKLRKELETSEELAGDGASEILEDGDKKRIRLLKAVVVVTSLNTEIAAGERKIRSNEEAVRGYAEDIDALKKAKAALEEYLGKCENRRTVLQDRVLGLKAKMAFYKGVDEVEYGNVCPVCKGIIADKADVEKDSARLDSLLRKYREELEINQKAVGEYSAKLSKVDVRLGQLGERAGLCSDYIGSLKASVRAKETVRTDIFDELGVNGFPALERAYNEAEAAFSKDRCAGADGGIFLKGHIDLISEQLAELDEQMKDYEAERRSVSQYIAGVEEDYNGKIAPELDGKKAYDFLDDAVAAEAEEDRLLEEINATENELRSLRNSDSEGIDKVADAACETSFFILNEIFGMEKETANRKAELAVLEAEYAKKSRELAEKHEILTNIVQEIEENEREREKKNAENDFIYDPANVPPEPDPVDYTDEDLREIDNRLASLGGIGKYLDEQITEDDFDVDKYKALEAELAAVEKTLKRNLEAGVVNGKVEKAVKILRERKAEKEVCISLAGAAADGNFETAAESLKEEFEKAFSEFGEIGDKEREIALDLAIIKIMRIACGKNLVKFLEADAGDEIYEICRNNGLILV